MISEKLSKTTKLEIFNGKKLLVNTQHTNIECMQDISRLKFTIRNLLWDRKD